MAWIYLVGSLVHTYILCILIYLTLSQKKDSLHYFDYTSPPKQTKLPKCREHRIKVALILLLFSFKKIGFLAFKRLIGLKSLISLPFNFAMLQALLFFPIKCVVKKVPCIFFLAHLLRLTLSD